MTYIIISYCLGCYLAIYYYLRKNSRDPKLKDEVDYIHKNSSKIGFFYLISPVIVPFMILGYIFSLIGRFLLR